MRAPSSSRAGTTCAKAAAYGALAACSLVRSSTDVAILLGATEPIATSVSRQRTFDRASSSRHALQPSSLVGTRSAREDRARSHPLMSQAASGSLFLTRNKGPHRPCSAVSSSPRKAAERALAVSARPPSRLCSFGRPPRLFARANLDLPWRAPAAHDVVSRERTGPRSADSRPAPPDEVRELFANLREMTYDAALGAS